MGANYSPTVYEESVSAVTATNSVDLGNRRVVNGIGYIYVYNAGTTQITKGQVCMPILGNTTGYSCTVTTTSGDFAMGFAVNATLTTATYGWVAAKGPLSYIYRSETTTMPSGVRFMMGADGTIASHLTTATWTDLNSGRVPYVIGTVVGTLASLGTGGIAWIHCPSW